MNNGMYLLMRNMRKRDAVGCYNEFKHEYMRKHPEGDVRSPHAEKLFERMCTSYINKNPLRVDKTVRRNVYQLKAGLNNMNYSRCEANQHIKHYLIHGLNDDLERKLYLSRGTLK